jgi:hypothetical protein
LFVCTQAQKKEQMASRKKEEATEDKKATKEACFKPYQVSWPVQQQQWYQQQQYHSVMINL